MGGDGGQPAQQEPAQVAVIQLREGVGPGAGQRGVLGLVQCVQRGKQQRGEHPQVAGRFRVEARQRVRPVRRPPRPARRAQKLGQVEAVDVAGIGEGHASAPEQDEVKLPGFSVALIQTPYRCE